MTGIVSSKYSTPGDLCKVKLNKDTMTLEFNYIVKEFVFSVIISYYFYTNRIYIVTHEIHLLKFNDTVEIKTRI